MNTLRKCLSMQPALRSVANAFHVLNERVLIADEKQKRGALKSGAGTILLHSNKPLLLWNIVTFTRDYCIIRLSKRVLNNSPSDRNPLDLVERNLILSAVIKFRCPRRFMVGDLLRDFEFAAVLQIRRNAGRAESMIANPRFDAGRFRAPADDAVGVLLEEGIGCKLAGLAADGTEEITVDVIGDASGFDIVVQT